MTDSICASCPHSIGNHFEDVTGVVRCLWHASRTSTNGIIGIPYTESCDCTDFHSVTAEHAKTQANIEKNRWAEMLKGISLSKPTEPAEGQS